MVSAPSAAKRPLVRWMVILVNSTPCHMSWPTVNPEAAAGLTAWDKVGVALADESTTIATSLPAPSDTSTH